MADFKPNHSGLGEVLRSAEMEAMLVAKAEHVKAIAEADAQTLVGPGIPTHYKDRFRVESTRRGGAHHDRAEARVVNDDEQALAVEFGIPGRPNYPKHRTLGKALDSLGSG